MMGHKNDSEAFPRVVKLENGAILEFPGMSLRDYFAAAALTGVLSNGKEYIDFDYEDLAAYTWKMADHMLEFRAPKAEEAP